MMVFRKALFQQSTSIPEFEKSKYRPYLQALEGREAIKESGDKHYTIDLSESKCIYPIYADWLSDDISIFSMLKGVHHGA